MNLFRLLITVSFCLVSTQTFADASVSVVEMLDVSYSSPPDVTPNATITTNKITNLDGIIDGGIYKSTSHGFQLKVPSVAGSTQIRVIQSTISRRPDSSPITADVIFLPDDSYGASALIVTRLRDDKPKNSEYILEQFIPPNLTETARMEQLGVTFKQINTRFGNTLQRTIKNSRVSQYFPYKVSVDKAENLSSLGMSRFSVVGEFLCEFVVIVDTRYVSDSSKLQSAAEMALDTLMSNLVKLPQLP